MSTPSNKELSSTTTTSATSLTPQDDEVEEAEEKLEEKTTEEEVGSAPIAEEPADSSNSTMTTTTDNQQSPTQQQQSSPTTQQQQQQQLPAEPEYHLRERTVAAIESIMAGSLNDQDDDDNAQHRFLRHNPNDSTSYSSTTDESSTLELSGISHLEHDDDDDDDNDDDKDRTESPVAVIQQDSPSISIGAVSSVSETIAHVEDVDSEVAANAEKVDKEEKDIALNDNTQQQQQDVANTSSLEDDEMDQMQKETTIMTTSLRPYYFAAPPTRAFKDNELGAGDGGGGDTTTIMEDSSISSRESMYDQQGSFSILIPYAGSYRNTGNTNNNASSQLEHDPLLQTYSATARDVQVMAQEVQRKQQARRERSERNFKILVSLAFVIIILTTVALAIGFGVAGSNNNNNQSKDLTPTNSQAPTAPTTNKTTIPSVVPTVAPNQETDTRPPTGLDPGPPASAPPVNTTTWPLTITGPQSCFETINTSTTLSEDGRGTCGNVMCADSVCQTQSSCCNNNNNNTTTDAADSAAWDETCVALACNDPVCGSCPLKTATTNNSTVGTCSARGDLIIGIVPDRYSEETSWTVRRVDTGQLIAIGGPYSSTTTTTSTTSFTRITETVTDLCVDGCYNFTILDSRGDGICCSYGVGDYRIWFNGGYPLPAVFGNGNFSESDSTLFGEGCQQ